jgi:hypothetical protein
MALLLYKLQIYKQSPSLEIRQLELFSVYQRVFAATHAELASQRPVSEGAFPDLAS